MQLSKPVRLKDLTEVIERLLPVPHVEPHAHAPRLDEPEGSHEPPVIYLVDDDDDLRDGLRAVLEEDGLIVEDYATCETFLAAYRPGREACLLIDAYLPGMSGLELLQHLQDAGHRLPAIMITGNSDVSMAVQAMKAGASDFIEKPVSRGELLASVEHALDVARDSSVLTTRREAAAAHVASSHAETARDHGAGACRAPQQEYRGGPRNQPAHGREPSCCDHEEDRLEVAAGVGPSRTCRCGEWHRWAARSKWTSNDGSSTNSRWVILVPAMAARAYMPALWWHGRSKRMNNCMLRVPI